jgi:hypothetical protein
LRRRVFLATDSTVANESATPPAAGSLASALMEPKDVPLVLPRRAARENLPRSVAPVAPIATHEAPAPRARSIAISTQVMAIVGDTAAGILLSQLIYWTRRGVDAIERDGWIFKTAAEWQHETGMSWKVQQRARALLCQMGLIQERLRSTPARLEFRLEIRALGHRLAQRTDIEIADAEASAFMDLDASIVERLIGRSYLFHSALARAFPVHTAMMCSRLMATTRGPWLAPAGTEQSAGTRRLTPFVAMHREGWHLETGLTRDQWQTARRNLHAAGVLVEKHHNYPRRIDLAVDLILLADVLRQGRRGTSAEHTGDTGNTGNTGNTGHTARTQLPIGEAGLDRAKLVGGIGHRPIPPSQSPDPAFSDRPIQPLSITQSRLYKGIDDIPIQPPRQNAGALHARGPQRRPRFAAFGWGGGGSARGYAVPIHAFGEGRYPEPSLQAEAPTVATAQAAPPGMDAVAQGTLVWPEFFTDGDRQNAARHLAGLDRAIQQQVLDEMAWQHKNGKAVRSPVALVRVLCRHVRAGTFTVDGAHRVAVERQRDEQREAERRKVESFSSGSALLARLPPKESTLAPEFRDRLNRIKGGLKAGGA